MNFRFASVRPVSMNPVNLTQLQYLRIPGFQQCRRGTGCACVTGYVTFAHVLLRILELSPLSKMGSSFDDCSRHCVHCYPRRHCRTSLCACTSETFENSRRSLSRSPEFFPPYFLFRRRVSRPGCFSFAVDESTANASESERSAVNGCGSCFVVARMPEVPRYFILRAVRPCPIPRAMLLRYASSHSKFIKIHYTSPARAFAMHIATKRH